MTQQQPAITVGGVPISSQQALRVFLDFSRAEVLSTDVDPAFPVLRRLFDAQELSFDERCWRVALYVTFYHLGSAEKAWHLLPAPPAPGQVRLPRLPAGKSRRCFRGNDLPSVHLNAWLQQAAAHGGLGGWFRAATQAGGAAAWQQLRAAYGRVPYAGPWATYKLAELTLHVLGLGIDAADIGVGGNSEDRGPVRGMVWLTGLPWAQCAADVPTQRALLALVQQHGVPVRTLDVLETCLCNVDKLRKGLYYVGHSIDSHQAQMAHCSPAMWQARAAAIPVAYRGEANGWVGVQKHLQTIYRDTGRVFIR